MASVSAHPGTHSVSLSRLGYGIIGGLAGGLIFGILMQMMGMMGMVAMLVGSESAAVGWLVHLAISAFIGASFVVLFARWTGTLGRSIGVGVGYGAIWWVLGGLVLMPARLGMGLFMVNAMSLQSLMGHLIYGAVLGLVYGLLVRRTSR